MKTQSVREQLLEHTLVLIRRRGVNGFSYRDRRTGRGQDLEHPLLLSSGRPRCWRRSRNTAHGDGGLRELDRLPTAQDRARAYLQNLRLPLPW